MKYKYAQRASVAVCCTVYYYTYFSYLNKNPSKISRYV